MSERSALSAGLRRIVKRSKFAIIGYTILHSTVVRARLRAGNFKSITGATHAVLTVDQSVAYTNRQVDDYLRYGNLTLSDLEGLTVFEGGPGDNLGVALRFLAAGAAKAVCMDKFDSRKDAAHERSSYLALRSQLNATERARFDDAIDLSNGIRLNESRLVAIFGRGMEEIGDVFGPETFDLLVSRGVVQEISDGDRLFRGMHKVLRRGGRMLHKIDLRDYGMFTSNGHNPLTILTIPQKILRAMSQGSDRPYPRMIDWYRNKLDELGFEGSLYRFGVVERDYRNPPNELNPYKLELEPNVDYTADTLALIREIRPRLQPRFRSLSDEDLMTSGIFMIATKR